MVWIAPVNGGGICVLVMEGLPGEKGSGSSCAPSGLIGRGALLTHSPAATRPAFIVGVPDGVPSVLLMFVNGTSTTVTVNDDIYATVTTHPVESVLFKADGVEQVIPLDANGLE